MIGGIGALFVRILSNPAANAVQKILAQRHSAVLINLYSYAFLSLFCFIPVRGYDWAAYDLTYYLYVMLAGILCTLGSVCLIKALQYGEMSVLGPINSYKCLVGLVFGYVILGEIPTLQSFLGVLLIICGSWFIFDTVQEGFSFKLFLRKDIILRFCALFFTGCEAVVLKKIILISSVMESFILWCFSGFVFSFLLLMALRIKFTLFSAKDFLLAGGIALGLGLMQYSTNLVFAQMNVGLSLALFQLSSLVAVIFGWKMFNETQIAKKIAGTLIMIIGSALILVT